MDAVGRTVVVALALVCTSGCGCSSGPGSSSTTTPAATTTTSTATAHADEPKGKLSPTEYATLVRTTKRLGRGARHAALPVCRQLSVATALVRAKRSECVQLFRMVGAMQSFVTKQKECTAAQQAGDVSCYVDLLRRLARSARVTAVRIAAVSQILHRRGIGGACASELAETNSNVRDVATLMHDSFAAARALEARDQPAAQAAAARLQADLRSLGSGGESTAESLRKLATCRR